MNINIASPLRSYTDNKSTVTLAISQKQSLREILKELNDNFPGITFRMINEQGKIRQHIKIFVNTNLAQDLDVSVEPTDTVQIIAALSGG
jgi:molybdopterin converting factor small subunit